MLVVGGLSLACGANRTGTNGTPAVNVTANSNNTAANNAKSVNTGTNPAATTTTIKTGSGACGEQQQAGKRFITSQTFPIDFKPFGGSCFVTFGSVDEMLDEKDVPRGSTFYIYKDGKQVFEFPDAFGGQPACWIEAVSFKDLNGDGLTDVVLAGSCLAAKDSYPSNAIYVNTGSGFTTNDNANTKLETFDSLKEIEVYVKKNVDLFY